jgi:hypothetical protein
MSVIPPARWALSAALLMLPTALAPRAALAEEGKAGVVFEPKDATFAASLAKAREGGKPVFIDFFTEW